MSQRHSRKRSSVTVKKRVTSPSEGSVPNTLGSPYPENNGAEWQSSIGTPQQRQITDQTMIMSSPSPICDLGQTDNMITRSEANLFDDDNDEMVMAEAPKVLAQSTSHSNSPSVKVLAHIPNGESVRYSEARKISPEGSPLSSSSVGGNRDGIKQKPLISTSSTNGSMRGGIRKGPLSASPSRSQFQSSPIRRIPARGKRMSLNYIASPATPRLIEVDRSATTNDSSSIGTPGTSVPTSSHTGYFPRQDASSITGRMAVPSSANSNRSCSATSASPTLSRMGKKEDGDTVMNQHKDILERIAEKERRVFEMKESLAKEEKDLRELQTIWQTSVNQGLASHQPRADERSDEKGLSTDSELRRKEIYHQPSLVAADGWKVFSATLAGAGTQINAFIDQLAPLPIEPERKSEESKARPVKSAALREESDVTPKTPLKTNNIEKRNAEGTQQDKRTSVFGASMAAIQKQVDAFSGIDSDNDSTPKAGTDSNTGWGTWQKRLKEARENASGLLAKAEQRLGQALVMEEPSKVIASNTKEGVSSNAYKNHRRSPSSQYDFGFENDREKAALAELTWLNSLAGVNMSGTTDRVTTSMPAEISKKKQNPTKTSNTPKEPNRRSSVASQSSNSSKIKEGSSPRPSLSNESDSTRKSGESSSLFSLLSTALSVGESESAPTDEKDSGRRSGQNKTRNAALTAVREKEEALKESRLVNLHSLKSPAQDSGNLVKVVEASEEHDDVAWGL